MWEEIKYLLIRGLPIKELVEFMKKVKESKAKVNRSVRLDQEVLQHFELEAEKTGHSVNALINAALLQLVRKKK